MRLSVREFAQLLGIPARTISKWEQAGAAREPRPHMQAILDTTLERADDSARARFAVAVAAHGAISSVPTYSRASYAQMSGEELVVMAARESADHARRHQRLRLHDLTIDQLTEEVLDLAVEFVTAPPTDVVLRTRVLRDHAFAVLDERQWPQSTRQLYALAGRLCGMLSVASSDFYGRYDAAVTQTRTAWLCAEMADHDELRSWIRSLQSGIAFWQGRWTAAADLAQSAHTHTTTAAGAGRASALRARAAGRAGDRTTLNEAVTDCMSAAELTTIDEYAVGVMDFSAANQVRCLGTAYLWIGDDHKAIGDLERAIAMYDTADAYAHVGAARTDLALAHLRVADLDAAQVALAPVLDLPSGHRVAGVGRRIGGLRSQLSAERFSGSPTAQTLAAELEDYATSTALGSAS